ncbi:MAG: hypothetical protein Q7U35_04360 [Methanobacteriaceae archaeon]|nr:hypothetical protein [Methanobacteriaceae archaeon]MDP3033754.1 hypothetical protein [Methanobacteriaceae archaeon]MDP3484020.1 hypothetical protein [Methanobacteriaceae archaeon]MDP3624532.1 hypothetical protein [Methanobacteriaceae archaeon]
MEKCSLQGQLVDDKEIPIYDIQVLLLIILQLLQRTLRSEIQ